MRSTNNRPELPPAAYLLAEMHHLGQPLTMYRSQFPSGLGCVLSILGFVCFLVPLGGFLYTDGAVTATLLQVAGASVVLFLVIALLFILPGFLTRNVRVYVCTKGLVYVSRAVAKRRVVLWEEIASIEGPPHTVSLHRPSLFAISMDIIFPGSRMVGRPGLRGTAPRSYCIVHLMNGRAFGFSQAIGNLGALEKDLRRHLRHLQVP